MDAIIQSLQMYLAQGKMTAYLMVLLGGVLSSLTPCIYPMIPITVGIIAGQKQSSRLQSFLLSLVFVVGIALTYSALGLIAVGTGTLFGQISSSPWVSFLVANICILLGLSMLGVYEIRLPGFLSKLQEADRQGGKYANVLLMGIVFGLVASPCTAPVLGVVLAYAGTTRSFVYGSSLLFVYAIGLGALLILVGTFAGLLAHMPRSGAWMVRIKKALGWLMIAAGEYFLVQMGKGMF